jgi:hypothetical protein
MIRGHCLLSSVEDDKHFAEWIGRINALPNYLIEQACDATVPLGMITQIEADAAKAFLKHRKQKIRDIVTKNQTAFIAIKTWSLI